MNASFTRRSFLRNTALTAAALSAARILPVPSILAQTGSQKIRCVQIGCGGRGMSHLDWTVAQAKEDLVAIVDADEKRHRTVKDWLQKKQVNTDKLQVFTDYRKMFDKMGKDFDAVFIATPNHHHALPAMMAMNVGKAVYCEKPLCHSIAETRKLLAMAAASKAPTQMGNQGHCEEGYRRLCEFVWSGVVGNITETHSWTDRANGGEGPRPPAIPVPQGLHWDEWIGPAPYREFHEDIHPHEWHGWYDFGNGSIGNMGCHVLDGTFWALKLGHPDRIECEEIRGGSNERYPTGSRIRWDFPARGSMPPAKVYWYEGLKKDAKTGAAGNLRQARGDNANLPPLYQEMLKKYPDEEFESNGTLYVGEKGVLYTGTYGGRMHLLPLEKSQEISSTIPKSLPRTKNVMSDFLDAIREGKKQTAAGFDYGARLTEFTLLGNLAQYAGVGKQVQWDGTNMKVTNLPELNQLVARAPRPGWTVA